VIRLTAFLLLLTVPVAFAELPEGADFPHRAGSGGSFPGVLLHTPPFTPGYHNGDDLVCADCHIMHASMQHDYGYQDPYTYPFSVEPPSNYLLEGAKCVVAMLELPSG